MNWSISNQGANDFLNELILDKKRILRGVIISLVIGITAFLVITFVTNNQNTWTSLSYINKEYLFFAFVLMGVCCCNRCLQNKNGGRGS